MGRPQPLGADAVEISDLYDAFHGVADAIWRGFHYRRLRADEPEIEPGFGELVDQLQADLFLPACARRLAREREVVADPDHLMDAIRLADAAGRPIPGDAGRFQGHAFDFGEPYEDGIDNELLAADGSVHQRPRVRLFLDPAAIEDLAGEDD